MHLLVLGGTGPVGVLLIQEALSASHSVVVYARSPQKLPASIAEHPAVTVIEGQLTDATSLSKALEGVHAVLSTLGPAVNSGPFQPGNTPLAHAYELLIELMNKAGIKRLIALGTASIKDEHDKFSLQFALLVSGVATFAHNAYKDVVAIGNTIRRSHDLVWTIVRVTTGNRQ